MPTTTQVESLSIDLTDVASEDGRAESHLISVT